jgi:hypothetical protein
MSQKNSQILGNEWITPSLVESEYPELIFQEDPITPVDSIPSVDSIFQENLILQEDSIDSKYSIDPQEIDVDPLTGMARYSSLGQLMGSRTALKDARLQIHSFGQGGNQARVTVTIKVELSIFHRHLAGYLGGGLVLKSSVWGIDGGLFNEVDDNPLFNFSDHTITNAGTYIFSKIVPISFLNEDFSFSYPEDLDEIAASINLVSYNSLYPLNKQTMTPIVTAYIPSW